MTKILVVADTSWVRNEVHAALTEPDTTLLDLDDSKQAAARVLQGDIDLVIVDMQIGSMGGMAVTRSVREQLLLNDRPPVPVVMLLDRAADGFLAGRAGAAAWVAKPFTSQGLLDAFWEAMQRETPGLAEASPESPVVESEPSAEPVAEAT